MKNKSLGLTGVIALSANDIAGGSSDSVSASTPTTDNSNQQPEGV